MSADADPVVREAVTSVRDRFGAHGLRDMIVLAQRELAVAEAAAAELARVAQEPAEPLVPTEPVDDVRSA